VYLSDFGVSELSDPTNAPATAAGSCHTSVPPTPNSAWLHPQHAGDHGAAGHAGTVAFMAPELLALETPRAANAPQTPAAAFGPDAPVDFGPAANAHRRRHATTAVDVWALGITLYALLYGKLPWDVSRSGPTVVDQIVRGQVPIPPDPAAAAATSSPQNRASPPRAPRAGGEAPRPPPPAPAGPTAAEAALRDAWATFLRYVLQPVPSARPDIDHVAAALAPVKAAADRVALAVTPSDASDASSDGDADRD